MKNSTAKHLQNLVLDITMSVPNGISHAQLVKAALQTGYRHPDGNLSEDLMRIVNFLMKKGFIQKNVQTRTIQIATETLAVG